MVDDAQSVQVIPKPPLHEDEDEELIGCENLQDPEESEPLKLQKISFDKSRAIEFFQKFINWIHSPPPIAERNTIIVAHAEKFCD